MLPEPTNAESEGSVVFPAKNIQCIGGIKKAGQTAKNVSILSWKNKTTRG